jgi:glycosyl transferase family protein
MNYHTTKVTVTVPVYNTSKYLQKCLDSLAEQTLKELEVIIVDDGSTDNSGQICDEYAERYPNFKVIHQPNGGLATARQTGLDAATGEYIIVCDSDDWAEPDMYERLYKAAKDTDADIVMCGFIAEYSDGRSVPIQKWFKHLDFEGHMKELFGSGYNNSWIRLVRRNLFIDNNIQYEPGVNLGEDGYILYKLMLAHPRLTQIDAKLYHYRKEFGGQSYTNQPSMKQILQARKIIEWLRLNYDNDLFAKGLYLMDLNHIFNAMRASDCEYKYVEDYLQTKIRWQYLFKYQQSIKAITVFSAKILPVPFISAVIKKLYRYLY